MSKQDSNVHSSFWLPKWGFNRNSKGSVTQTDTQQLLQLASGKRAISNFVNIVTNKSIPVKFNDGQDSFTNGKFVVVGTEIIKPKDFDVAVGLALHEASHIKLSDFSLLQRLDSYITTESSTLAELKGISYDVLKENLKLYCNYVEDRRIDTFIYNESPGYRAYYVSFYNKYYNSKLITKALASSEFTDESLHSYQFRVINIHNPKSVLTALNGLQEIYDVIDLTHIDRLSSSEDSMVVALKIMKIILTNLPIPPPPEEGDESGDDPDNETGNESGDDPDNETGNESGDDSDNETGNETGNESGDDSDNETGNESGDDSDSETGNDGTSSSVGPESGTPEKLTDDQRRTLENQIKKQIKFVDGDIERTQLSSTEKKKLDVIDESGTEMVKVAEDFDTYQNPGGVNVVVVKKVTKSVLDSEMCPLSRRSYGLADKLYENEVLKGIRIGTILGKKLQVRGESRNTVFNRQKLGKIDKRMIASLGFGNENVFEFTEVDSFKKANLHFSIDGSGSMDGIKWNETITNVTAMCKAVDMIQNLEIQITVRTTDNDNPYVAKVYDSRSDKFSKVKQIFPYLDCRGTTPEGLCFEAIMEDFLQTSNDVDSYFVNISDGNPYYSNRKIRYSGDRAHKHTRKMVKKIQNQGISVLSYFVDDGGYNTVSSAFKTMYGDTAKAIDVTNINQISKTMNKLFLQKG